MSRLTKVQQDVIDRLRDGWELIGWDDYRLEKRGEASRHVANATVDSLSRRGLIRSSLRLGKMLWLLS